MTVLALPLALMALGLATACLDAVLSGGRASAPFGEVARLLVRQRRRTPLPDLPLLRIGVISLVAAPVLAGIVIPLGDSPVADLSVGIVWFNAMEVCVWGSLWLTGWSVNSVFPLVGAYRFVAQGLAYELPHMFALITVALGAGSMRMSDAVQAQQGLWFVVWMPLAFLIYLVSALAMAFWGPMSQPLGADIAGGVPAELSGPDRLLFQAGRHALLVVAAAAAVPLFLGGGAGPVLPSEVWVLIKTMAVLGLLVWIRHRVPAVRMDRFTQVSWLVLIPLSLVQLLVVGVVVL
ncbi:NADH-quinone oxidoreductase subunit H [Nonomuraea thailandensis]|uniref:NADH-quinone oxidoreductase subunit H n=1 Tax=Nonomuraea thailandensis TaxID=1188745 RepID=A0A9X2K113_9ACTN|nr:complex I subunit 1 family protein [Nonomuraea thailandensis]MCP2355899.1 NADH-quinone oxidoreductase subunit H [Nonomuraea thailandensis]